MLPPAVKESIEAHLGAAIGGWEPVGGGCIARGCRVETMDGTFFVKWGEGDVARTFWAEAEGLRVLRAAVAPLVVPAVLALGDAGDGAPGFLLMEWIAPGKAGPDFWEEFGRAMAELHRHTSTRYGFDEDNYIGRLPQHNDWAYHWPSFFGERRLLPQVQWAREHGRWSRRWDRPVERLLHRLDDYLPPHPEASLLHGDLWSGNVLVAAGGRPALIDPAVYYGHREADLAMTELFGGFEPAFYEAYREAWPLDSGYAERRDLYNLYHLLNHLNHFGDSYAGAVAGVLKRYA